MRMKLNYLGDSIIVDWFNSLLPDNYFIYKTADAIVKYDTVRMKTEYFIPVRFCRKHNDVMRRIDCDIFASVRLYNGIIELERMMLSVDLLQWEGEWDITDIDVKFINYRDVDTLKRAVSYDAKCLARGCPTVTIEVHD